MSNTDVPTNEPKLIIRAELLKREGVSTAALGYRIREMDHPKPARRHRRVQWFNEAEVKTWCELNGKEFKDSTV